MILMENAYNSVNEQRNPGDIYTRDGDPGIPSDQPTAAEMGATPERDKYTYPLEVIKKDYTASQRDMITDTFKDLEDAVLNQLHRPEVIEALYSLNTVLEDAAIMMMPPLDEDSPDFSIKHFGSGFMNDDIISALDDGVQFDLLITDEQGRVIVELPSEVIEY